MQWRQINLWTAVTTGPVFCFRHSYSVTHPLEIPSSKLNTNLFDSYADVYGSDSLKVFSTV